MATRFQNGLLLIATLATLFAVGELIVRGLAPFPSWEHEKSCSFPDRYDAELGWSGIPGLDREFAQREFAIRVRTNAEGFRDDAFEAKRARSGDEGSTRIALLGDSFVWGWGVEREQRVGERLEAMAGGATVFNLAQCGYGTDQEYLTYLRHGPALEAEIVLLFFFANDLADVNNTVRYERQRKPRYAIQADGLALTNVPVPLDEWHWERKRKLRDTRGNCPRPGEDTAPDPGVFARLDAWSAHSQLANWLRFRGEELFAPQSPAADASQTRLAAQAPLAFALLDTLAARVAADGARFAVVLVPEKRQVLAGETTGALQEITLAHCERTGLRCIDLLPALAGHRDSYFRIDPHWSAAGHRRAAEQVYGELHRRGWL